MSSQDSFQFQLKVILQDTISRKRIKAWKKRREGIL